MGLKTDRVIAYCVCVGWGVCQFCFGAAILIRRPLTFIQLFGGLFCCLTALYFIYWTHTMRSVLTEITQGTPVNPDQLAVRPEDEPEDRARKREPGDGRSGS